MATYPVSAERALFQKEDELMAGLKKVRRDFVEYKSLMGTTRLLAVGWKNYSKTKKEGDCSPRINVAIKHGAALMNLLECADNENITEVLLANLRYGREETPEVTKMIEPYDVPVREIPKAQMVGIRINGNISVFRIIDRVLTIGLEEIADCSSCPAGGRCNPEIYNNCASYSKGSYAAAREEIERNFDDEREALLIARTAGPTPEDWQTFMKIKS